MDVALSPIVSILTMAAEVAGDDNRAVVWFKHQPIPGWAGKTAYNLVGQGKSDQVLAYQKLFVRVFMSELVDVKPLILWRAYGARWSYLPLSREGAARFGGVQQEAELRHAASLVVVGAAIEAVRPKWSSLQSGRFSMTGGADIYRQILRR